MNNNILHTFVVLAYKESKYLKRCIESVLNQDYKSKVIIATSTPNDYIDSIANQYGLEVIINTESGKGIGYDFDFAVNVGETPLVTIAHQDDVYEKNFSLNIIEKYIKNKNALLIFSDYYEIRNNDRVNSNTNLKIKRVLLTPLKIGFFKSAKPIKRSAIRFGNAICCPSVTFVKPNIPFDNYFECELKCDIDWYAWERISKLKGAFVYVNKKLMGHRIHTDSTTTEIISENVRTVEDLIILKKMWPNFIAKQINKLYKKSEDSNN